MLAHQMLHQPHYNPRDGATSTGYYPGDLYAPAQPHHPPAGAYHYAAAAPPGHHGASAGYVPVIVNVGSAVPAAPGSTLARLEGMEAELEALKLEQTEGTKARDQKIEGAIRMTDILNEGIQDLKGQLAALKSAPDADAKQHEPSAPQHAWAPWGFVFPPQHHHGYPHLEDGRLPWEVLSRTERSMAINQMYDNPHSLRAWLDQVTEGTSNYHSKPPAADPHARPAPYGPGSYYPPRVGGAYPEGRYI